MFVAYFYSARNPGPCESGSSPKTPRGTAWGPLAGRYWTNLELLVAVVAETSHWSRLAIMNCWCGRKVLKGGFGPVVVELQEQAAIRRFRPIADSHLTRGFVAATVMGLGRIAQPSRRSSDVAW